MKSTVFCNVTPYILVWYGFPKCFPSTGYSAREVTSLVITVYKLPPEYTRSHLHNHGCHNLKPHKLWIRYNKMGDINVCALRVRHERGRR
jgi:hypothetical protein